MLKTIMFMIAAIYSVSFLAVAGLMVSELFERQQQDDIEPTE